MSRGREIWQGICRAGNFGIGYWAAADVIIWQIYRSSSKAAHRLIAIAHRDLAVTSAKILEIDNLSIFNHVSYSRGWDFGSKPSVFTIIVLEVLLRSLPPFPIYSFAGTIDGGNWRGKDASGDCGNTGAARLGVGGFPGVLLIKVCVLLQPGGIVGIILIVFSSICFWVSISVLSASFSAASGPVSNYTEALL